MKKRIFIQLLSLNLILLSTVVVGQNITLKYVGQGDSTIDLSYDSSSNSEIRKILNQENNFFSFPSKNITTIFCPDVRSRTLIFAEPNDTIEINLDKNEVIEYSCKNNKYRASESDFIKECFTKYGATEIKSTKEKTAMVFAKDYHLSTYIDSKYIKEQELLEDYFKKDKVSKAFHDYFKTIYWCLTLNNSLEDNPLAASSFLNIEKTFKNADQLLKNKEYRALLINYNSKKAETDKKTNDLLSKLRFTIAQKYSVEVKDFLLFELLDSYIKFHPNTESITKESILFQQNCKNADYLKKIYHDLQPKTIPPFIGDILKKHIGKLVLIDFWASYCMPCRAEFPSEKELMLKYPNMEFLFFSIDKGNVEWEKAMAQYSDILTNDNSFLLTKAVHLDLTEKINLIYIPRYLLIGKDGKIIDVDAPRPSSKELKDLIEKNL